MISDSQGVRWWHLGGINQDGMFRIWLGRRRRRGCLSKHSRVVIAHCRSSIQQLSSISQQAICPLPPVPVAAFFAPQETPRPSPSPELLPDPPHFLNTYSSPLSSSPPLPDPSPLQWLLPVFTTSRRESVLLFTLQLRFRGTRACCDKAAVRALPFNEAGEK